VLPLGPTAQHQDGTIRRACAVDLRARDQPARRETRAERLQAAGRTLPWHHGARGRATRGGPARRLQRVLPPRPIACASAPQPALHPCWQQPADEVDQGEMARFGTGSLRGGAYPPGQRQGAPFRDDRQPQRGTPAAHTAAIQDEPHRLQGERPQQDVRRGQKGDRLQDVGVVKPPRTAFDAALGVGAVGHVRGDVRPVGALAAHDPAEARRQGEPVPGDRAGRLARIPWCSGLPYGTISAEVVTHRLLLLDWLRSLERVDDGSTS
jgi:hypothetical protein